MGQALGNLKNINEANLSDLSTGEKLQRGLMGGASGGLRGMGQRQQPQMTSGAPIGIAAAPQYDFSQLTGGPEFSQKRNPFYGGY